MKRDLIAEQKARRLHLLEDHEIQLVLPEFDTPESQNAVWTSLEVFQRLGHATIRVSDENITVTERLTALMRFFQDTEKQAADRIGLKQIVLSQMLQRAKRNERSVITDSTLTNIALGYNVPRSFLMGDLNGRFDEAAVRTSVARNTRALLATINEQDGSNIKIDTSEKYPSETLIRSWRQTLGTSFREIFQDPLKVY